MDRRLITVQMWFGSNNALPLPDLAAILFPATVSWGGFPIVLRNIGNLYLLSVEDDCGPRFPWILVMKICSLLSDRIEAVGVLPITQYSVEPTQPNYGFLRGIMSEYGLPQSSSFQRGGEA